MMCVVVWNITILDRIYLTCAAILLLKTTFNCVLYVSVVTLREKSAATVILFTIIIFSLLPILKMTLIPIDRTLFESRLINELRDHPNLFTKRSQLDFHEYTTIEQSWEIVAQQMDSDTKTCKKIWRNLRDSYVRQLKKINCSVEIGADISQYTKWKHFEKMAFLKNVISHRTINDSKSNDQFELIGLTPKIENSLDLEGNSFSSDPVSDKETFPNDNKSYIDDDNGEITNSFLSNSSNGIGLPQYRHLINEDAFGNHVARSLENLSTTRRSLAKVKIQEILSDFEQEESRDPANFMPNIFLNPFK